MDRQRLIFIGLDGVGLDLARNLAGAGVMPRLGELLSRGQAWETASPLPEVSPVCWTTLFSGVNPGRHGVFGFGEPVPGEHRVEPVDATSVRVPRLWDELDRAGRSSLVLGVPLTYPATPITGIMVSGFVVPRLARAVHPPGLLGLLRDMNYQPEPDLSLMSRDGGAFLADLTRVLDIRLQLYERLLGEAWCLYTAVFTETDRICHLAWPALWEDAHPLASAAREPFGRVDAFLGGLWDEHREAIAGGGVSLLIAADHGFGPIRSEVYLNRWLMEKGYLEVNGQPGEEMILPSTRALALDPGRIYLHRELRFPGGRVRTGAEAQTLARDIAEELLTIRWEGPQGPEAAIARVHLGQDLYSGPWAHLGPDLVAEAAPGFSLRAGMGKTSLFGISHLQGTHRPKGGMALWLGREPLSSPPSGLAGLHGLMSQELAL